MPHADPLKRALTALSLFCLIVGALGCERGAPAEVAAAGASGERFDVQIVPLMRKPGLLVRTDTATGEAWRMVGIGKGEWEPLREGPDGPPSAGAEESGRYRIKAVTQRKGAPTLVRLDRRTGRIWRKGSTNRGAWVAVPEPGDGATPTADAKATADPASNGPSGND